MKKRQRFQRKAVAWLAALTLAVQPAAGAVMYPAVEVNAADRVEVTSMRVYDGNTNTVQKNEDGLYTFVMPYMNGEPIAQDGMQALENSFKIQFLDNGKWVDFDEALGEKVGGESALKDKEEGYYTDYWVWGDKGEGGWGMGIKLSEDRGKMNTIRFQSVDYENVNVSYTLVGDLDAIESIEFKDADGDNKITVGPKGVVALNFDYLRINEGVLGAGQYGQDKFEWKVVVDGQEQAMDKYFNDIYGWNDGWGWDSYPTNGGYWFPVDKTMTVRACLKDNTSITADYEITVLSSTKGPEYSGAATTSPAEGRDGYKLVWQDEFGTYSSDANVDEKTGLNLDNWSYQLGDGTAAANNPGWGNAERQSYTKDPGNVKVENGLLRITAKYEEKGVQYSGDNTKSYYSSARIVTKGDDAKNPLFTTTYGYVEARMALPETVGAWPAFWMLPQSTELYGAWPVSGEIDIMETCGFRGDEACATLHWGSPDHVYLGSGYQTLSSSMSNFHTYAVDWAPGEISFYYDDKLIYTQTNWESRIPGASDSLAFDAPFDQPYYILLNLAVDSGQFGGNENVAAFKDDINMYVDYVRVYHKNEGYDETAKNLSRKMQNSKEDWASKTGTQIAELTKDNLETAADGDMNTMETAGDMNKDKWYLAYTADGEAMMEPFTDADGNDWAKIDVKSAGTQNYSVQLIGHYKAQKGYLYKVSLDAYAEGALLGKTASCDSKEWKGWGTYGVTSFELESTPTNYSFLIDQQADFDDCRIEVNLGAIGAGTAYVGNVKVEIIDPETLGEDGVRSSKALSNGELLYNGSFDQGKNRKGFWMATEGTDFSVPPYTTEDLDSDIAIKDVAADQTKYFAHRAEIKAADENAIPAIYQNGFSLSKGEYVLSFDLYSKAATTVSASIRAMDKTGEKLGNILMDSKEVTHATRGITKYTWTFENPRDLKNAALVLSFGPGSSVQIDNVSLLPKEKVTSTSGTTSMHRPDSQYLSITYNMNDMDGEPAYNADENPTVYVKGEGSIVLADPIREGATFAGWSLNKAAQFKEDYVTEVSTNADSITLFANWGERVTDSKDKNVTDITLSPEDEAEINVGEELTLNASLIPADAANQNVTWEDEQSEDGVAEVTSDGLTCKVKGLKAGTVTITVTSEDGDYAAECVVTVVEEQQPVIPVKPSLDNIADVTIKATDEMAPITVTLMNEDKIDGELSYRWYQNTSKAFLGATEIEGATEKTYTPQDLEVGVYYFYCIVTNTNENATTESKEASTNSSIVTYTVTEGDEPVDAQTPRITSDLSNATYVAGANATEMRITAIVSDGGSLSYQWYSGASEDEMDEIEGATTAAYTPDISKAGITYYYCIVTNTNDNADGAKTAQATSHTAMITVNGVDAQAPIIVVNPQSASYTFGQTAAALSVGAAPADGGILSYQWYECTAAGVPVRAISGAVAASYTPTLTAGDKYYYCQVKNTNAAASGKKEATTNSSVAKVSVAKAAGNITVVPEVTVTYKKNATFTLGATGYGTLVYQSSKPSVVAVDAATGVITIKNTGKAVIGIASSGDANHNTKISYVTVNVAPTKVTKLKVKSYEPNQMTVSWKKNTKATGYEIQYSTNKKFKSAKTAKITKNKKKNPTKTIKKLKSGKKYYVRIRAYKNKAANQRVYSAWSGKKTVKVY